MPLQTLKVLGIDTSLRSSGVGVVEARGNSLRGLYYGVIKNPQKLLHTECLAHIHQAVQALILEHHPDAAAVEGIFHHKNARTAMILGQARGVVLASCSVMGVPVYEYAPRSVKQAVVGTGAAHKDQVGKMVMAMLGLRESPPEDAADALAIAVAHIHQAAGHRLIEPKRI